MRLMKYARLQYIKTCRTLRKTQQFQYLISAGVKVFFFFANAAYVNLLLSIRLADSISTHNFSFISFSFT